MAQEGERDLEVRLTELENSVKSLTDRIDKVAIPQVCVECSCGPCAECWGCRTCYGCAVCRVCRVCRVCQVCYECGGGGPCLEQSR